MGSSAKIAVVVALAVAVGVVVVARRSSTTGSDQTDAASVTGTGVGAAPATTQAALPRLVCLGAGKCIACKAMDPVREALRQEYAGRLLVEYHDVHKDPDRLVEYDVQVIPTMVFIDAAGKELDRHEGFISKDDIVARFRAKGVSF